MWRGTAVVACLLAGCSSSGSAPPPARGGRAPGDPADDLANRDGVTNVQAYRRALDAWAAKCAQGRVAAAGIVDATWRDEYAAGGPDRDRLDVMRHLTRSVPPGGATDCTGVAAAYLVLVEP